MRCAQSERPLDPRSPEDSLRSFLAGELERDLPRLRSIGHRILGCHERAEDAVQEALARLWQLGDRPEGGFGRWLAHAVVHRSLHIRRTEGRRDIHEARAADARLGARADPLRSAVTRELRERVSVGIESLPKRLRAPFLLRYSKNMTYREIARELSLPLGTVRSRLNRARHLLALSISESAPAVERSAHEPARSPSSDPRRDAVCPHPDDHPECGPAEHPERRDLPASAHELDRAARIFKALGDPARFRLLLVLQQGEACVSELVASPQEPLSSVSSRLRLLRLEGLVRQRRDGKHIFYSLADEHVAALLQNALEHSRR